MSNVERRFPTPSAAPEVPQAAIENRESKNGWTEEMRTVMGETISILAAHGESTSVTDDFGERVKELMNPRKKEVIHVRSVSREIPDEEGKLAKITLASFKGDSSKTEGFSISSGKDYALLLVRRGKKITAETRKRLSEISWNINTIDATEGLEFASRNLKLLQESLRPKK